MREVNILLIRQQNLLMTSYMAQLRDGQHMVGIGPAPSPSCFRGSTANPSEFYFLLSPCTSSVLCSPFCSCQPHAEDKPNSRSVFVFCFFQFYYFFHGGKRESTPNMVPMSWATLRLQSASSKIWAMLPLSSGKSLDSSVEPCHKDLLAFYYYTALRS